MPSLGPQKTTEQFITESKILHGDKFSYEKTIYVRFNKKVIITCQRHGDFFLTPRSHLAAAGCIKCNKNIMSTEEFIEKALHIHGDRYNYSLVNYVGIDAKVEIKCLIHGIFLQTPYNHLHGKNCPRCAGNSRNLTTKDFIESAMFLHEYKYSYEYSIYTGRKEDLIIKCYKHGNFSQTPDSHLGGAGCPDCARQLLKDRGIKTRLSTEEFIKRSIKIYGNIYSYNKVKYQTSHDYVTITCKEHGDFNMLPYVHLAGSGCKICGILKSISTKIQLGQIRNKNFISDYELYRSKVWNITAREWNAYEYLINPIKLIRGKNTYHLDHIFSIQQGFRYNIPCEILGNYTNLRIISSSQNQSKSNKSDKELFDLYNDYIYSVNCKDEVLLKIPNAFIRVTR